MNNDTLMTNEIKLEPDFAAIRAHFAAEARLGADTILDGLLPETIVPFDSITKVQVDVLRAFQSVLVPINACIQAGV